MSADKSYPLDPCKFCGSPNVYKNGNWEVECGYCGVTVICGNSDEEMVAMWNRRPQNTDLIQDAYYWVWRKGKDLPFVAQWDKLSAGGWTNNDTWEDFFHEIDRWELIPEPKTPPPVPPAS